MTAPLTTAEEFRTNEQSAELRFTRRQRDMLTTLNTLLDELSRPLFDDENSRSKAVTPPNLAE